MADILLRERALYRFAVIVAMRSSGHLPTRLRFRKEQQVALRRSARIVT
jgi:hypothetical protein